MIRACIFDLGGTIVDKYSMTPFLSFKNAFQKQKINIPDRLIYNSMGKDKKEHIQSILDDSKVQREWITKYNSYPTKNEDCSISVVRHYRDLCKNNKKDIIIRMKIILM